MERYRGKTGDDLIRDDDGDIVLYADAQATVEALQAQLPAEMQGCTILFKECEKGHGRLVATNWRDHGCQTCEVDALQRERDGAYKQGFADALEKVASDWASKEFRGHDEIQGVEVQAFLDSRHVHYEECRGVKPLQAALDAEREKVKGLKQQVQDQSTANLETMRHTDDMQSRALDAERALTQLQALVRALPCFDGEIKVKTYHHESDRGQEWDEYECGDAGFDNLEAANVYAALLKYRATLGENS